MKEASALTTGESDPEVNRKRTHQHIDEYKKLKLVKAVKLGLSVGRAARIVKMPS